MYLSMMRCKIHGATVTQCDLHYEGSISIDAKLLEASGLLPGEEVHVWNVSSGSRIVTYVIEAPAGSAQIGLNGAAARHFQKGDTIIIASFAQLDLEEAKTHRSSVAIVNPDNSIKEVKS